MGNPSGFTIQARYIFPLLCYLRMREAARKAKSARTRRRLYRRITMLEQVMPPILLNLYRHHGWSLETVCNAFQAAH